MSTQTVGNSLPVARLRERVALTKLRLTPQYHRKSTGWSNGILMRRSGFAFM